MHDEERRLYATRSGIIKLTLMESKLLSLLIKNKGKVVSYYEITKTLYPYNRKDDKQDIRPILCRLRNKVFEDLDIVTVIGYGLVIFYKLRRKRK